MIDLSKIAYYIPNVDALLPKNMDQFWTLWNKYKKPLTKAKNDNIAGSQVNDTMLLKNEASFDGMIVWYKSDGYLKNSTWEQNVVLAPSLWDQYAKDLEDRLPWYEVDAIVLWSCIKPVLYHIDPNPLFPGPVAVRALIHDTNPSPTFKVKHTATKQERHVPYSADHNLFLFNNANFLHGADYNPSYSKILMRSFGRIKSVEKLQQQIDACKKFGMPIWDLSEQGEVNGNN
jgi:hypothetical protein